MNKNLVKNPYVVTTAKYNAGYCVSYRYVLSGVIRFNHICTCPDKVHADLIAKLLNAQGE